MNSADRVLLNAFREVSQMGDRLNLPKMVSVSLTPGLMHILALGREL